MAFELWMVGGAANLVISLAYAVIAAFILTGVFARNEPVFENPLALATGLIFLTCSVGHGNHAFHVFASWVSIDDFSTPAARAEFGDWHVWAWDGLTAVVGVWYLSLRKRYPALVRGSAMFEDLRERRREALQIHDEIMQKLVEAKLSLDLKRGEDAYARLHEALESTRDVVTDLLGEEGEPAVGPGTLRHGRMGG